jgi:hypothetical protein
MTEDSEDREDIVEVLEDIRRWIRIIGLQEVKPVLKDALSNEDEERQAELRRVFHLTDGTNSTREIDDKIEHSRYWVMDRYEEWSNMGLIETEGQNSSYKHVISLEEAGIEVPDFPVTAEDVEEESIERDEEERKDIEQNSEPEDEEEEINLTDY